MHPLQQPPCNSSKIALAWCTQACFPRNSILDPLLPPPLWSYMRSKQHGKVKKTPTLEKKTSNICKISNWKWLSERNNGSKSKPFWAKRWLKDKSKATHSQSSQKTNQCLLQCRRFQWHGNERIDIIKQLRPQKQSGTWLWGSPDDLLSSKSWHWNVQYWFIVTERRKQNPNCFFKRYFLIKKW